MDNATKQKLWKTADQLRSNMDAAEYKHVVLGLIFLKYISDSFSALRNKMKSDDYYKNNPQYIDEDMRDYCTEHNAFWVPNEARWEFLRDNAPQPNIGKLIDDAMLSIEKENPKLKNILNKNYARLSLPQGRLADLINTISTIGFENGKTAPDALGEVYEYFLGMFADAEGKRGGQFYTAASVVKTMVAIMAPTENHKVYDPCCGSGGMFVQSERFVQLHQGTGNLSIYGQESNPTTWRLAAMNLAIRGIEFNLGQEPADTFHNDQHPNLRADYILANPPFNISDWGGEKLTKDPRWQYGIPPAGNANYAWIQHMLSHLAPTGVMGTVLANGSMSSNTGGEGEIRQRLLENDLVECMVALPGQLFFNTQIPVCLWFLRKQKKRKGEVLFIDARNLGFMADRTRREFTDADIAKIADTYHAWRGDEFAPCFSSSRTAGCCESSPHAGEVADKPMGGTKQVENSADNTPLPACGVLSPQGGQKTVGYCVSSPHAGEVADKPMGGIKQILQKKPYADIKGFCKSATLDEIKANDYVLTPGRYVGVAETQEDDEAFSTKMARLTAELTEQMTESAKLDAKIKENLAKLEGL